MASTNIYEAKAKLSQLVKDALAGEEVIIARAGKPLVRLVPVASAPRAPKVGLDRDKVWIAEDFDTLPIEELRAWEGGPLYPPRRRPKSKR